MIPTLLLCLLATPALSSPAKQAQKGIDCPMQGQDCAFNDIERAPDANTWQECAWQCANHRTCAYWSWHLPSAFINPYGCWLKSGCGLIIPDPGVISGQYSCTNWIFRCAIPILWFIFIPTEYFDLWIDTCISSLCKWMGDTWISQQVAPAKNPRSFSEEEKEADFVSFNSSSKLKMGFGNWEDPPLPPCWEKLPNNPVFFFRAP